MLEKQAELSEAKSQYEYEKNQVNQLVQNLVEEDRRNLELEKEKKSKAY